MSLIIDALTPPPYSWFGLNFQRNKLISQFVNQPNADFLWQDGPQVRKIGFAQAEELLYQGKTISRLASTFTLNVHFDALHLSDETLSLECEAHVKITDAVLFYKSHSSRLNERSCLTSEAVSRAWAEAFYNAVELECRKTAYSNWKLNLTPGALRSAIQSYFNAPFARNLASGIELLAIDSIHAFSPSMEKKLQEEIEQKKQEEQHSILQQEREELQRQLQAKEDQLKELQEERRRQEEAFKAHLEQERTRAEQEKQAQRQRDRLLIEYKNRWLSLSDSEKIAAAQLSEFFQKQADNRPIKISIPSVKKEKLEIDFCLAEWNTLSYGASLAFSFTASQEGFVTILNLGTSGQITALIPNSATGSDKISVHAKKNAAYNFPQTFLPSFPADSFEEQSRSGLEGIYVLITPEPLISVRYTGQLNELPNVSYSQVLKFLDSLKALPKNSWSVGVLEFQVVEK